MTLAGKVIRRPEATRCILWRQLLSQVSSLDQTRLIDQGTTSGRLNEGHTVAGRIVVFQAVMANGLQLYCYGHQASFGVLSIFVYLSDEDRSIR
jgi:hypothetical protein